MNESNWDWCYFGTREVRLARSWAADGGIAVHENIWRSSGRRTAHLLGPDEEVLISAALYLGCHTHWIQRTRTIHFDLVGPYLHRALSLCGIDPLVGAVQRIHSGSRDIER